MTTGNDSFTPRAWLCVLALGAAGVASAQAQSPSSAAPPSSESVSPEAWFDSMDKDRNKQLSVEEFKSGLVARNQALVFQRLQSQFKTMDKNSSGFLEANEFYLLPVIKNAGRAAPTLVSVDTSKDGKLDFREYVGLIARMAGAKP